MQIDNLVSVMVVDPTPNSCLFKKGPDKLFWINKNHISYVRKLEGGLSTLVFSNGKFMIVRDLVINENTN